jgi:LmbE family N-acetylglucosaminyl deacetylase
MPSVLALFAHPDDLEFRAAGTLLLLRDRGWEVHYCNLSNGDLGSSVMTSAQTARIRATEARRSCESMGFHWHPPIGRDLQILYTDRNVRQVCALVRKVRPGILLTHPLSDYMEDHMETARIAVTAAFARGIPNYRSIPSRKAVLDPVTVYHSTPHGLRGPMREPVIPEGFVDITSVADRKRAALACHASQKEWLDVSQGMDSYLLSMEEECRELGRRSGKRGLAEGWSRHLHLGFGSESDDPLRGALDALWSPGEDGESGRSGRPGRSRRQRP